MTDLTSVATYSFDLFGLSLTVNTATLFNTWLIMIILIIISILATRRLSRIPNPLQRIMEVYISFIDKLVKETLETTSRGYLPLIGTLFMFLLLCNWIGIVPGLHEPTKDLNTPLSLAIMGFFLTHTAAIREKGILTYLKDYAEPLFIMAPLNVITELAKVLSISFRLFGNIFGGYIIIAVISPMVYHLVLPPFMAAFFGLFVGIVQAFVFTMLTITYIAVATK